MLNGSLNGLDEKYYKDSLYLEIVPSLLKNGKSILTNLRRWHFFDTTRLEDDALREKIEEYVLLQELCGFDNNDECYNKKAGKRGTPICVPIAEALENIKNVWLVLI